MSISKKGHTWYLDNLPGVAETQGQNFEFNIGELDYIEKGKIYLHIPEHPHRDAEGRPQSPEQSEWVNRFIQQHQIGAKEIWFSTWEFKSEEEARRFEKALKGQGAINISS
ncbi:hypothetical protein ACFLYP_02165 [Chloroflexota bacterium]